MPRHQPCCSQLHKERVKLQTVYRIHELVQGKVILNCLPATLVAILKVLRLPFIRTQNPQSTRSRSRRPSVAVLR